MYFEEENSKNVFISKHHLSNISYDFNDHRQIKSEDEMNQHFQLLLDPEKQEEESIKLRKYFLKCPFNDSYSIDLIKLLINFFNEDSKYGVKGANIAARIISAFLIYEYDSREKNHILDTLLDNSFYEIIWPFFDKSSYVILTFQFALLLEKTKEIPVAYNFLMSQNFLEVALDLLQRDFDYKIDLLCLINAFDSYHWRQYHVSRDGTYKYRIESYENFIQAISELVPLICQITFTSTSKALIHYGTICLSNYGKHYLKIGLDIFDNENFQKKIKDFEKLESENADEVEDILVMVDEILQNEEPVEEEENSRYENCSMIREKVKPNNSLFVNMILIILNSTNISKTEEDSNSEEEDKAEDNETVNNETKKDEKSKYITAEDFEFFCKLSLSILSHLYYTKEDVNSFIENGLVQQLFNFFSVPCSFKTKIKSITVITNLVEFSDVNAVQYFIDNGFFDYITEYLDELMTEIPNQVISSLELINRYGETKPECHEWCSLIFDNDDIVSALDNAAHCEYADPGDSCIPLHLTAQAFLSRRYNDCIPE